MPKPAHNLELPLRLAFDNVHPRSNLPAPKPRKDRENDRENRL
jgi:hypothetical protein